FLLDPTETCGYPLDDQIRLLEEVRALFPDVPLVVAENKADLEGPSRGHLRISSLTGAGVIDVLDRVLSTLTSRDPAFALRSASP
ncbi:MAG TPA: GTP-binding protein, partial [Thermoplasmata archaeon]|nr:GTP-binding protein [Thermoplasmata archaeon]